MEETADPPFEPTHDVSRWDGFHTDGPNSQFVRCEDKLVRIQRGQNTQQYLADKRVGASLGRGAKRFRVYRYHVPKGTSCAVKKRGGWQRFKTKRANYFESGKLVKEGSKYIFNQDGWVLIVDSSSVVSGEWKDEATATRDVR